MSETFQIHTHKPKAQIPKKVNVTADGKIKTSKPRAKKEVELDADGNPIVLAPPTQRFEITHGEKSCIVKMGNMSFGIKLGDMGIESVMRNTESKDNENIRAVLAVMKQMKKANISFEAIATRLTIATETLPQSIKQFSNNLNKPVTAKPVEVAMNDAAVTVVENSADADFLAQFAVKA
jgi:hypothetical protein